MGRVLVCGQTQKKPLWKMVLTLALEECTTTSQLKRAARGPVVALLCADCRRKTYDRNSTETAACECLRQKLSLVVYSGAFAISPFKVCCNTKLAV